MKKKGMNTSGAESTCAQSSLWSSSTGSSRGLGYMQIPSPQQASCTEMFYTASRLIYMYI